MEHYCSQGFAEKGAFNMARFKTLLMSAAFVAVASLPVAAQADVPTISGRTVSGTFNGLTFQAQSRIVGTTSTFTAAAGGNPIYFPQYPRDRGVVAILSTFGNSTFICSGTLTNGGMSVITAAHCMTDGFTLNKPDLVRVFFYGGNNVDAIVTNSPDSVVINAKNVVVNPNYTGQVIDQNDIAVINLASQAPSWANVFELSDAEELEGLIYTQHGYGGRGASGLAGVGAGTGRLRNGDNSYDLRLGDPEFGGFFTDQDENGLRFFDDPDGPSALVDFTYLSDFDSGNEGNDASCIVFGRCNAGVGARESNTAGGDSGGPQFVNGKLASITSFGLTFGPATGDSDNQLNSSFGEFSGVVPVYIHRNFITLAYGVVPEPSTWAMMILGFGIVGGALRRQRRQVRVKANVALA
jgi:hypothetical protein